MNKFCKVFFCFLYLFKAFGQDTLDSVKQADELFSPGMTSSISLFLKNETTVNHEYSVSISSSILSVVPLLKESKISISANSKSLLVVPVRIANEAPAGNYAITIYYWAEGLSNKDSISTILTVSEVQKIKLSTITNVDYVQAGQTIKASFLLSNQGNTTDKLILNSNAVIEPQITELTLNPGESKMINVVKVTDAFLENSSMYSMRLTASLVDQPDKNWYAYNNTMVIAKNAAKQDAYFRFPLSISLAYLGMRQNGQLQKGFQGEINGKGSLNRENTEYLELKLVSPNPVAFTSMSQFEQYYALYKNRKLYILLGDYSYTSSYLTEIQRFGRGAEIHYAFDKVQIGGFYNHPRFFKDIQNEFSFFSTLKLNENSSIRSGYLFKSANKIFGFPGGPAIKENIHIPYIIYESRIWNNLNVITEAAFSKSKWSQGFAYRLLTDANFNKLTMSGQYLHAGPGYDGYYTNSELINANINYQPFQRFYINAYYNQSASNVKLDTLFLSAPLSKGYQLGLSYRYFKYSTLSVYSGFQSGKDRLALKLFDYEERYVRVGISQDVAFLNLRLEGQYGKTDNFLLNTNGISKNISTNLSGTIGRTTLNLFGSIGETTRYSEQSQRQVYYGGRLESQFLKNSHIILSFQNNFNPEEYYADRNLFELRYSQDIFQQHKIELAGRYTLQKGQLGDKDFIMSVRYIYNLNVPVQKVAEYTTLYGKVINMGVKSVAGIRLTLGSQITSTDSLGNFVFKNVVPGQAFLNIDKSSMQINEIPDIPLPVTVNLSGKENIFNFGLTNAGNIEGTMILESSLNDHQTSMNDNTLSKQKGDFVIVEISTNNEVYRKLCALDEPFNFTYLRPGIWTLKVYRNNLNIDYLLSKDTFEILLAPNEIKKVEIGIEKKQKQIKYQSKPIQLNYGK